MSLLEGVTWQNAARLTLLADRLRVLGAIMALQAFRPTDPGPTLEQLLDGLGTDARPYPKALVDGILATLIERGLVAMGPAETFALTPAGARAARSALLGAIA